MQDDNLPARPEDDPQDRLPVQRPGQLAVAGGQRGISLDVFEDKRGGDEDEIDLLAYWRILVKRKWLVLGVLGTVVGRRDAFSSARADAFNARARLRARSYDAASSSCNSAPWTGAAAGWVVADE